MGRNQTSRSRAEHRLDPGELSVFLAGCEPGMRRIVAALRRVVRRCVPGAGEGIRFGCICYFEEGKQLGAIGGNICMIEAKEGGVRLSFIHDAVIDDPGGLLRGEGKHKRYVEVGSAADAGTRALADLIRRAGAQATRAKAKGADRRTARHRG